MSEEKNEKMETVLSQNIKSLADPDNFQKYILGTKKNGHPRAAFDIVKDIVDMTRGGKKKKKKHKKKKNKERDEYVSSYAEYLQSKKHKKKKKNKHWHI